MHIRFRVLPSHIVLTSGIIPPIRRLRKLLKHLRLFVLDGVEKAPSSLNPHRVISGYQ